MMFKELIGKTMKVFVDNVLVKQRKARDHMANLEEMYVILREYHMKPNLLKCAFGVRSRKFLRFMVNKRCIEAK